MSVTRDALEAEIGARAVGTAAIDGRNVPVAFPTDETQVLALLRLAAERGWRVLPIGSGTKLDHGPLRTKPRFLLSTRGLSGITSFERGDGTLTARAGSTIAALSQTARTAGMHVTPDPAGASHATLGGVLGAGASGVDRLRFGPVRHHVLGMRVALADGTIATTGGRLVKNVTGYDLHRLYTGSRGSLGVILEASLRLFPAPERAWHVSARFHRRASALAVADEVARAPIGAWTACVSGPDDGAWTLDVHLAGRREPLAAAAEWVRGVAGPLDPREDAPARAVLAALRERELDACVRASLAPSRLAVAWDVLDAWSVRRGVPVRAVAHVGVATIDATWTAGVGDEPDAIAELVRAWTAAGAVVELRRAPLAAREAHDPARDLPAPVRALHERLARALDPNGRFAGPRPRAGSAVP